MNAALGSITTPQVGDVAPEDQDLAGEYLHGIAKAYGLYFPSTMTACHSGPSFTYTQKHGGAQCRPDFIAIPIDWSHGKVASRCDAAIHAAHSTPDHVAARVDVEARFAARPATVKEGQRIIIHICMILRGSCIVRPRILDGNCIVSRPLCDVMTWPLGSGPGHARSPCEQCSEEGAGGSQWPNALATDCIAGSLICASG